MKKIISLLSVFILSFVLVSCSGEKSGLGAEKIKTEPVTEVQETSVHPVAKKLGVEEGGEFENDFLFVLSELD